MLAKYNFRIATLKYSFAILAVICLLTIFLHYKDDAIPINNEPSKKSQILSSEVEVSKPVFSSNGENPYRIFAESITKDANSIYHLSKISGIYNLNNIDNISILARECFLNTQSDNISLNKDVKIGFQNYTLSTDHINVDLTKKSAENDDFVMLLGDNGKVTADRIKTNENFCNIILEGNVKAHFDTDIAK